MTACGLKLNLSNMCVADMISPLSVNSSEEIGSCVCIKNWKRGASVGILNFKKKDVYAVTSFRSNLLISVLPMMEICLKKKRNLLFAVTERYTYFSILEQQLASYLLINNSYQ